MNALFVALAVVAVFVWVYAICVIADCSRRQPLTKEMQVEIDRIRVRWIGVLIVATLLLGFSLERLLP